MPYWMPVDLWFFVAVGVIIGAVNLIRYYIDLKRKDRELNIKQLDTAIRGVSSDTMRRRTGLPGLPAVVESYENSTKVVFPSVTSVPQTDIATPAPAVVAVPPAPAVAEAPLAIPLSHEIAAEDTMVVSLNDQASVQIGFFPEFDLYHADLIGYGVVLSLGSWTQLDRDTVVTEALVRASSLVQASLNGELDLATYSRSQAREDFGS